MQRHGTEQPAELGFPGVPLAVEPIAAPAIEPKPLKKAPAKRAPAKKSVAKPKSDAAMDGGDGLTAQASPTLIETAGERLAQAPDAPAAGADELAAIVGRVKWFDATRGFGFLISDAIDGDILLHFSTLREHGRRSIPEGALVECIPVRLERGLQAKRVLSIDLGPAAEAPARPAASSAERADRKALADAAGEYEPVVVKWFNRVKGYGFVNRPNAPDNEDVFVHMETVRNAGLGDLQPGQCVEARIAASNKGLTAVELRTLSA